MNQYYPPYAYSMRVDPGHMWTPSAPMTPGYDAAALATPRMAASVGRCPSCASVLPMIGQSNGGGAFANCNWTEIIVSGLVGAVIATVVGRVMR